MQLSYYLKNVLFVWNMSDKLKVLQPYGIAKIIALHSFISRLRWNVVDSR